MGTVWEKMAWARIGWAKTIWTKTRWAKRAEMVWAKAMVRAKAMAVAQARIGWTKTIWTKAVWTKRAKIVWRKDGMGKDDMEMDKTKGGKKGRLRKFLSLWWRLSPFVVW